MRGRFGKIIQQLFLVALTAFYPSSESTGPGRFLSFTAVCKGLPGVHARRTLVWLRDEYCAAGDTDAVVDLKGTLAVARELGELFRVNDWGSRVVTPTGAALLLRLYEAGSLEHFGATLGPVSDELHAYVDSDPGSAARQYRERIKDLSAFREDEFSASLFNALFWEHAYVQGLRELTIGGIVIGKLLESSKSNSGKTRYWRATYVWTGSDGVEREVSQGHLPTNRRNDPERNWGLGRE